MRGLLATHGRRVVRQDRSRRDHVYGSGQVFDKVECPIPGLMRHLRDVALIEVALLAGRVTGATSIGPLVAAPRLAHGIPARRLGAVVTAVPVAVVAVEAEEEHLPTSSAGHEP
jgi:hypothetical protein